MPLPCPLCQVISVHVLSPKIGFQVSKPESIKVCELQLLETDLPRVTGKRKADRNARLLQYQKFETQCINRFDYDGSYRFYINKLAISDSEDEEALSSEPSSIVVEAFSAGKLFYGGMASLADEMFRAAISDKSIAVEHLNELITKKEALYCL